jgi:hypothetical protein
VIFFAITDILYLAWFDRFMPYFYRRVTVAFGYHGISQEEGLSPENDIDGKFEAESEPTTSRR